MVIFGDDVQHRVTATVNSGSVAVIASSFCCFKKIWKLDLSIVALFPTQALHFLVCYVNIIFTLFPVAGSEIELLAFLLKQNSIL